MVNTPHKVKKVVSLLAFAAVICLVNSSAMLMPESQTRTIINKMMAAVTSYKSCTYTMRSEERLVDRKDLRGGDIFTKLNVSPRKSYMKMVTDPNKGTEILYVDGERNNKALVNPGKFLPTLSLNPNSGLLTKDQHHTCLSAGFDITGRIIGDAIKKADAQGKFDEVFKYAGDVTWNGRSCYKVVIADPTWTYTTYKAVKGDNLSSVSAKLLIPEYSITELDGVKSFEDDLGGKTLKVPTSYAKTSVFYIDKENNFPVYQEMSDDKGVFERYQFFNLVVNPSFKPEEFTKGYSEYKF
jgi:outer membrane lipoprotein-sorting protein